LQEKHITANPFADVSIRVPKKAVNREDGKAFSDTEQQVILKAALASFCRERQNSTAESGFPAFFGGKFCLPVRGAMSLI
jgi:hypothetical protein